MNASAVLTDSTRSRATLARFSDCIVSGEFAELEKVLSPAVRLRALLPRGPEERVGAASVVQRFRDWFDRGEHIAADHITIEPLADRWLLAYRFRVASAESRRTIAQQAFCDVVGDRMTAIDLVCSGYREDHPERSPVVHLFDAGDLGCADGLSQAFRDHLKAVAPGEQLEVVARDPVAREDLPALARLMGIRVLEVKTGADGVTRITLERVR